MYDKIKPKNNRKSETEIQTDTIIKKQTEKTTTHGGMDTKTLRKKAKR